MKSALPAACAALMWLPLANASEDSERDAGDALRLALPAAALSLAVARQDDAGMRQLAYTTAASELTTVALKQAFSDTEWGRRPNGGDQSFPSGHATTACSASFFMGRRYGWGYGGAALPFAAFVAYSRVNANAHHWRDVIAGCAVGAGYTFLFVDHMPARFSLVPAVERHGFSLTFSMPF